VEDGYEGAIIRNLKSPYQHRRTEDLLKVKPEDDAEFEIIDIEEGEGNWSGTGKTIWFRKPDNMIFTDGTDRFKGTFKGSKEQSVKFLNEKKMWIGRSVTVLYNGLTGIGKPNYARMDINNCLKGDR
jgi:ATP-dependent DNA ligase